MGPDFLDFFGGAGGWSLGLSMAGLSHRGHFDHDASACGTPYPRPRARSTSRSHCIHHHAWYGFDGAPG